MISSRVKKAVLYVLAGAVVTAFTAFIITVSSLTWGEFADAFMQWYPIVGGFTLASAALLLFTGTDEDKALETGAIIYFGTFIVSLIFGVRSNSNKENIYFMSFLIVVLLTYFVRHGGKEVGLEKEVRSLQKESERLQEILSGYREAVAQYGFHGSDMQNIEAIKKSRLKR